MHWEALPKPAEMAENRLIAAILDGHFPINSNLPPERDLAARLGVTRPTLREALQRLARDGWVEIRHGRPTRVRDYWQEGSLGVLGAIARRPEHMPSDFVPNLLAVRQLLAPAYTRRAVECAPAPVQEWLLAYPQLADSPQAYADFDLQLHTRLTIASGNPIFTLILNGFRDLYVQMACVYFTVPAARAHSQGYYSRLLAAFQAGDAGAAEAVTRQVMGESLGLWLEAAQSSPGGV